MGHAVNYTGLLVVESGRHSGSVPSPLHELVEILSRRGYVENALRDALKWRRRKWTRVLLEVSNGVGRLIFEVPVLKRERRKLTKLGFQVMNFTMAFADEVDG